MEHLNGICNGDNGHTVYKLVLTGGPCGGKTTTQARMSTFFENLGWKVFRVPEAATILLGAGVKFSELSKESAEQFQEDLIKTMLHLEETFFNLAELCNRNCMVICDRGPWIPLPVNMDPDEWKKMLVRNGWNTVMLRDQRYNQVLHLVSTQLVLKNFTQQTIMLHVSEGLEVARNLDNITMQAWVGHPYFDVIDNSDDFDNKIRHAIAVVCDKLDIDTGDRLSKESIKRKFLVTEKPDDLVFPKYKDFDVMHDYLVTPDRKLQARLRRRGQNGVFTYMHTIRRPKILGQNVELRMTVSGRDYEMLLAQRDQAHWTVHKLRRCFLWQSQYWQMDMYIEPCPERCKGLILLETFTTEEN